MPNANVVRNITSIAFQNPSVISEAKNNCSHMGFIKDFRNEIVDTPLLNFSEAAKRRMFAHWVLKDEMEFQTFKKAFQELVLSTPEAKNDIDRSFVHTDTYVCIHFDNKIKSMMSFLNVFEYIF